MHESEAIERLKNGDEAAYREVVEEYNGLVLNCCFKFVRNKESAEDLTQEVFLEVFASIHAFRGDARLSTWIYRIAVTRSLNYLKSLKRKKRFAVFVDMLEQHEPADAAPSGLYHPESEAENNERARVLSWALEQLPDNQRVAFTLSKYEELSYEEVSRIMDTSIPSVESLIHRAKMNLRKILYRYYKNEPEGL